MPSDEHARSTAEAPHTAKQGTKPPPRMIAQHPPPKPSTRYEMAGRHFNRTGRAVFAYMDAPLAREAMWIDRAPIQEQATTLPQHHHHSRRNVRMLTPP